jgi:hypothetical protein
MLQGAGALVVAMAFAAAAPPGRAAVEWPALPPFTVTALDGTAVAGATLAADGNWLFVQVRGECGACEALLAHIASVERPAASRIVIVGTGMDQAAVAALAERYPALAASRWVADPPREVVEALAIKTAPTVFGMRKGEIHWRLAGPVRDKRELESILFTWLEKP